MRILLTTVALLSNFQLVHAKDLPAPLTASDFPPINMAKGKLGQLLFYDPILSGNRNISCSTCHHPNLGTGDGLSLGIGEGGVGLGIKRQAGTGDDRIKKRIPRNAPGLWNLGAKQIHTLFHDGRLSISNLYQNGYNSPAEEWLPKGLSSILAAQALFPLTAQFEMAGNPKENEVAGAAHDRIDYVWPIIAKRVRNIPEYIRLFTKAFDDVKVQSDITIVHIANALGAFMDLEWRSFDSPFDKWLSGHSDALDIKQQAGMALFFGKGRCATCHSGNLFTDQNFYALALPQFGPGRTRRFDPRTRDVGFMGESDRLEDAYRFRTPSLRNVALTAPYGHNGAYPTLEGIIKHHLSPLIALDQWKLAQASLPEAPWLNAVDVASMQDQREKTRLRARLDIIPVDLTKSEINELIAFLTALTGTNSIKGRLGIPSSVPSGLAFD